MSKSDKESTLRVVLEYRELKTEFEGSYDEVWKVVNQFLRKVKETVSTKKGGIIRVKGKQVGEILIGLRDQGFFDEPRTSIKAFERLQNLGKTDITRNAVSMALKDLTATGELKRRKKDRGFVYFAPYIGGRN